MTGSLLTEGERVVLVALWVAVAVLSVGLVILLGAQVEQFEQLKQLRRVLDLEDRSEPIDLGVVVGSRASAFGLPAQFDHVTDGLVLFLSNRCATCHVLAAALHGGDLPPRTWVVVVPISGDADNFIDKYELRGERILVDKQGEIVEQLGLSVTPSALIVQDGLVIGAHTVPSVKQLKASVPPGDRVAAPVAVTTGAPSGAVVQIERRPQ